MLSNIIRSTLKSTFSGTLKSSIWQQTKQELLGQAKELGITGRWGMRKPDLARAVKDAGGRVDEMDLM